MVFDPMLSHFKEEIGHRQAFKESRFSDNLLYFSVFALDKIIDEGQSISFNESQIL